MTDTAKSLAKQVTDVKEEMALIVKKRTRCEKKQTWVKMEQARLKRREARLKERVEGIKKEQSRLKERLAQLEQQTALDANANNQGHEAQSASTSDGQTDSNENPAKSNLCYLRNKLLTAAMT